MSSGWVDKIINEGCCKFLVQLVEKRKILQRFVSWQLCINCLYFLGCYFPATARYLSPCLSNIAVVMCRLRVKANESKVSPQMKKHSVTTSPFFPRQKGKLFSFKLCFILVTSDWNTEWSRERWIMGLVQFGLYFQVLIKNDLRGIDLLF